MKFILKRTRPRFAEINSASYLVRALKSLFLLTMCFFRNRWMKREDINDYGNHKRRSNNKTCTRIELKKKRKSAQFLRPGISVKKFTRAVFRKQTHFLCSPKHLSKSLQATCFSMRQKVPIST